MTALTMAAFSALIQAQSCVPAKLADVMTAIAFHESHLNPLIIHDNTGGINFTPGTPTEAARLAAALIAQGHDLDLGIGQVNVRNFKWTGLTIEAAFDPCQNIAAGAKVLLSKYQGNPPDTGKARYAALVLAVIATSGAAPAGQTAATEITGTPAACTAPPWDTWAQQGCRESGEQSPNTGDDK
jgi:type IV secretion system protein VirB1